MDWGKFFNDPGYGFSQVGHGIENYAKAAGRGLTHPFNTPEQNYNPQHQSAPVANPNDPLSGVGYGVPKQASSLEDQIKQFGSRYGLDPMQVYNDIRTQDPSGLKDQNSLATALGQYAQAKGLGSAGSNNAGSIIDPLSVQMFYQQTIAPYLKQVAGNESSLVDTLKHQQPVPGLSPQYNATIKQGQQNQATDAQLGLDATLAAGAQQPRIDQLNQMLGLLQQTKLKQYYQTLNQGSATANPFSF